MLIKNKIWVLSLFLLVLSPFLAQAVVVGDGVVLYTNTTNYTMNHTINCSGVFVDGSVLNLTNATYNANTTSVVSLLNLTAYDQVNNVQIQSFTATLNTTGYSQSETTTNGILKFFPLQNNNLTLIVNVNDTFAIQTFSVAMVNDTQALNVSIFTAESINVTLFDEITKLPIQQNSSVELISDTYSNSTTFINGSTYFDTLPTGLVTIRYDSTGYSERFYYVNVTEDSYNLVKLYLLNSSLSTNTTITVYDEINDLIEDVYIHFLRYYVGTNAYEIVAMAKTNFEGVANIDLQHDTEFYKLFLYKPFPEFKKSTSPAYVTEDALITQVVLTEDIGESYFETLDITGILAFNNLTNNFRFDFSNTQNLLTQACLEVNRIYVNQQTTNINTTCVEAQSGSILVNVNNVTGATYEANAYVTFADGDTYIISQAIKTFFEDNVLGDLGLFLIVFLMIGFALTAIWSPTLAVVITPLPLLLGTFIGFITIPIGISISLQVIAIMVAYMMRK